MKFDWNRELLEEISLKSYSQKELLLNLGLKLAGGNYINLRKYLLLYNISTSSFDKILSFKFKYSYLYPCVS